MKYCTFCGASLHDEDTYCNKCGRKAIGSTSNEKYDWAPPVIPVEPKDKLCCELAYTGTLFWLPLIVCPDKKDARYHANQGLWLLILSALACTAIRILSFVNDMLSGGLIGVLFSGVYSLVFIIFLFGMIFLLWSAVTQAMGIHRDESPRSILFFDKAPIIRF